MMVEQCCEIYLQEGSRFSRSKFFFRLTMSSVTTFRCEISDVCILSTRCRCHSLKTQSGSQGPQTLQVFLCFVTPVRVGVILNGLITNDNDLNSVTLLQLHLVASTATDLEVASAEDSCLMLFGGARVKCAKATAHLGCIYCSCIDELFQHTVVFIHNLHIENLLETTFSNFLHHTSRVPSKFGKYAALHCTRLFFVILSLFRGRPC